MILSIGTNTKRLSINNYNALKISVACLFRESLHPPFTPRVAVAVALWATSRAATICIALPTGKRLQNSSARISKTTPRLRWIFGHNPLFFVTFCTFERRKLLASDAAHAAFVAFALQANSQHNIAVARYVIMPDHVHLFAHGPDNFHLGPWVGLLKQALAKRIAVKGTSPIWQRGFFDHVLRNDESYGHKWNYVRENPVRAGLVTNAEDWPYSGEILLIDRA